MKKLTHWLGGSVLFFSAVTMAQAKPGLDLVTMFDTGQKKGTEIISIQSASKKLALSNSKRGIVDIYDISRVAEPTLQKRVILNLKDGEEITSVAVHKSYPYFLAAIQDANPEAAGRIEIRDLNDGSLLNTVASGVGPDAVVVDPTGRFAMVPNEGESFIWNKTDNSFHTPEGSMTLLSLTQDPKAISAKQIALPDLTGTPGMVSAEQHRFIERGIDWNQDGEITEEDVDLDGNGYISGDKFTIGKFRGESVIAEEEDGELFLFPLTDNKPDLLEPEYPAFSDDGNTVWVTLQENNGVIVVDTASATIKQTFGLGITKHAADIDDDNHVSFTDSLEALREPDGITTIAGGKFVVTADEGDTDPKASKSKKGPAGGGRTISIYDAESGKLIADTANQIDEMAAKTGIYPDSRSDNKGSEPEMLVGFQLDGIDYVAVGLERANAVALVSVEQPSNPIVLDVAAIDPDADAGDVAPEGIAHYVDETTQQHYIFTANEKNGTLAVFHIKR